MSACFFFFVSAWLFFYLFLLCFTSSFPQGRSCLYNIWLIIMEDQDEDLYHDLSPNSLLIQSTLTDDAFTGVATKFIFKRRDGEHSKRFIFDEEVRKTDNNPPPPSVKQLLLRLTTLLFYTLKQHLFSPHNRSFCTPTSTSCPHYDTQSTGNKDTTFGLL